MRWGARPRRGGLGWGPAIGGGAVDFAAPGFDTLAHAVAEDALDDGGEEVEDVADLEEEQEGLPGGGVEEVGAVDAGEGLELRDLAGAELVHEGEARHAGARRWRLSMVPSRRGWRADLQEDWWAWWAW